MVKAVSLVVELFAGFLLFVDTTFRPFKHRFLKKKIFGAVIAAVWITAWLFASIMVLYEIQILTFERFKPLIISFFSLCMFCLLIITVSYSSIAIKIVCGTQLHHHGATTRERKLTKTLFIVTVVSSLLALPFIIFNPIFHAFKMPEFRRALFSFLPCRSQPQLSAPVFPLNEM